MQHISAICARLRLQNALKAPDNPKFRRVRQRNAAFRDRLGSYPEAIDVLHLAGTLFMHSCACGTCLSIILDSELASWLQQTCISSAAEYYFIVCGHVSDPFWLSADSRFCRYTHRF